MKVKHLLKVMPIACVGPISLGPANEGELPEEIRKKYAFAGDLRDLSYGLYEGIKDQKVLLVCPGDADDEIVIGYDDEFLFKRYGKEKKDE